MKLYLYLCAGGIVGVLSRFQLGVWISSGERGGSGFPLATLMVNVTGSFLLGFLMRYLTETAVSREIRAMLTVGLCGGYTTFSSFSYETMSLLTEGAWKTAAAYSIASVVGSLLACFAGYALAEIIIRR